MDNLLGMNGNGEGSNFAELLILLLLIGAGGGNGLLGNNNRQPDISNEWQTTQNKLDGLTASTNSGFANTQMGFAALAQQLSKCCCDNQLLTVQTSNDTNRHIDQVLFNVTQSGTQNTQHVIDRVDALQDSLKDQRIRDLETQLSACTTRDAIGNAISPINAAVAAIVAQLNCGVKAVAYTPSLPIAAPAAYAPIPAYPAPVGYCGNNYPGFGWNN